jgi:hypothetical protein
MPGTFSYAIKPDSEFIGRPRGRPLAAVYFAGPKIRFIMRRNG